MIINHISQFNTPGKQNKLWGLKKASGNIKLNLSFVLNDFWKNEEHNYSSDILINVFLLKSLLHCDSQLRGFTISKATKA